MLDDILQAFQTRLKALVRKQPFSCQPIRLTLSGLQPLRVRDGRGLVLRVDQFHFPCKLLQGLSGTVKLEQWDIDFSDYQQEQIYIVSSQVWIGEQRAPEALFRLLIHPQIPLSGSARGMINRMSKKRVAPANEVLHLELRQIVQMKHFQDSLEQPQIRKLVLQ